MVTIKQIADMCGVSRGTVDRVLNNRGNVKPDKQKLILDMAKKLNYIPNPAGRALVSRRSNPTVGVILPSKGIRFFDDVIDAMKHTVREEYTHPELDWAKDSKLIFITLNSKPQKKAASSQKPLFYINL